MTRNFMTAAMAALIGLGGLTLSPPTASADSVEFYIGDGGGAVVQYRERDRYREHDAYRPHHGWDRPRERRVERRDNCSPRLAVDKARDFGLRRAFVADVSRRRVVVEGRIRGNYERIVFANVRGCPVIR